MKKRLIALAVFLILLSIPMMIYWRSLAASVVISALDLRYGLSLLYDRLDFDLLPGQVTLLKPILIDSQRATATPIVSANQIHLSILPYKAIQGIVDMRRFSANKLSIELVSNPPDGLNWTQILKRIVPASRREPNTIALAETGKPLPASAPDKKATSTVTSASLTVDASRTVKEAASSVEEPVKESTQTIKDTTSSEKKAIPTAPSSKENPNKPLKIPVIDIDDLSLNYSDLQSAETYVIHMDRFSFTPKAYKMVFQNAQAMRMGHREAALTVKNLELLNALAPPGNKLEIVIDTAHLNGRQTGPDQFDFNHITQIWVHVYREIGATVTSPKPTESKEFPIASLKARNVSADVLRPDGQEGSPGSLSIAVNDASYVLKKDELTLLGVDLKEAGKSLLRLDRMVLTGLTNKPVEIQNLALDGARLDIQEDSENGLNIARAIRTIRSIIDSLIPKDAKTAQAKPPFLDTLRTASLVDCTIAWNQDNRPNQQIALGQMRFDAASRILEATDFLMTRRDGDKNMLVSIPSLLATPPPTLAGKEWERLVLNRPGFELNWRSDRFELVEAASDWLSLPGKISRELNILKGDSAGQPFAIRNLQIDRASARVMDYTIDPPILHSFDALNLQWNDLQLGAPNAPMTPMILEAALSQPSAGSLMFQGWAAPSSLPVNVTGTAVLVLSDITALNPYLSASEKALPVRIVKGGLRTNAQAEIINNRVNGIIDLYLYDPEFMPTDASKWPLKIDQKTVINTLNNMKDKNGVIAFPNNAWTGDIRDPKFKRGLGLNDLLWSNVRGTLTTVLKLPFDFVGSVGNAVKKILGQE